MESIAERNWDTFTHHLAGLLRDCERRGETEDIAEVNVFIERILVLTTKATKIHRACSILPAEDEFREGIAEVARQLRRLLYEWSEKKASLQAGNSASLASSDSFSPVSDVRGAGPGRPRKNIEVDDVLHHIIDLDYTITDLAKKYGVHRSTIYRHLKEAGINITEEKFSDLSQEDINHIVIRAREDHGFKEMGQKVMFGYLRSIGVRTTREQVREACREADPVGTALRHPLFRVKIVTHAAYDAKYSQYIWHIDGVEKLQMYAIYSFSVVDGHSKKVMAVNVSGSKRKYHVYKAFYAAFHLYGIPSMVRVDHGYENEDVKKFMDVLHGRTACIAGESTRNQPVEKWHQYEEKYCLYTYRRLFRDMEEQGDLDKDNKTDLMLLHYIFIPRINDTMRTIIESWNRHHGSTLHHKSPDRVWEDSVNSVDNEDKSAIQAIPLPKRAQKYHVNVDWVEFERAYENVSEKDLCDPRVELMPAPLREYLDGHITGEGNDMGRGDFILAKQLTSQFLEEH